jgi:HD-GYP domain-containing protein (c-di-GMP phosphodiesterase class II)
MTKTITVDRLKPGMYVVGMDRSWFCTPFFSHRRLLQTDRDIALLRQSGVLQVTIDPEKGLDVEEMGTGSAQEGGQSPIGDSPQRCLSPFPDPPGGDAVTTADRILITDMNALRAVYKSSFAAVSRVFEGVKTGAPIDNPALRATVTSLLDHLLERPVAMLTLVQFQQMKRLAVDRLSHAVDVCILSLIVGHAHGLDRRTIEEVGLGAVLHDIGETRLPQNLFLKTRPLQERELELMKEHPRLGVAVLRGAPDLSPTVLRIVADHHERLDGSGYPNRIRGEQFAMLSQIVALVDRYDALASTRNGRPPLQPSLAIRELYQLGLRNQYDKTLTERLIQCLGVYPVGSVVQLTTGEQAVVVAVHPDDRLRPIVKLITDADGHRLSEPVAADLHAPAEGEPSRTIARILDAAKEQIDVVCCSGL